MSSQQPENTIGELRTVLFETMRSLKPGAKREDIEAAKALNDIAQTIINSAKVEIDALRATGGRGGGTSFIPLLPSGTKTKTGTIDQPAPGVTRHTLD